MDRVKRVFKNKNAVTLVLLTLFYAVIAWMLWSGHITRQFTNMIIPMSMYIVLAVSLNLVVGFLGELNLGHAGFMSIGLFSGCLLSIALSGSLPLIARLPLSMLAGGICAGIFGFAVGMPALRLKGDYLAIVTLACGEIVKNVITNLSITGGARGLNTQPIYSGAKALLPYAVVLVFVTVIVMMHIKKSKQGRAIMAIRDNRIAAESIGLNVTYYKLAVFIIAAFFAPIISIVNSAATCGALVIVGFLMMGDVVDIDWTDLLEGFPAFMIVAGIPLTYSISSGIGFGFISYVVVAAVTGQLKKVKPLMWVATLAFVVYFLIA